MKQISVLTLVAIMAIILCTTVYAQLNDAQEILTKVDEVSCAPEDQYMKSTMVLVDKSGNQKEREMVIYQKGGDKRLVRFLSPADQKGISFLSLPNDLMYLYLPAFRKVRMIASHVKNQNFAGTDFSYDDMSSFSFAKDYDSQLIESPKTFYSLKLAPKPELEKDYSQLKMWVNKDSFVPSKIEYYDKNGNLWKTLTFDKIEKLGKYQIAKQLEMKDLKKSHSTKMIVDEIKLDSGISDDIFTKRNLKRIR
jgi:outer membrane lipoprotein-sorting protein